MQSSLSIRKMTTTALLIALGLVIPMFSPAKVFIPPAASFTLASHVPVFLAMFISPWAAAAVALGTTLGFFMTFPLVVALRAASHLVFAILGSLWLKARPQTLVSSITTQAFSFILALIHAACELLVVTIFYLGGTLADSYYSSGFVLSVLILVGAGTVVHSMLDFLITIALLSVFTRQRNIAQVFPLWRTPQKVR